MWHLDKINLGILVDAKLKCILQILKLRMMIVCILNVPFASIMNKNLFAAIDLLKNGNEAGFAVRIARLFIIIINIIFTVSNW